jgi:DNA protecting protein DprA
LAAQSQPTLFDDIPDGEPQAEPADVLALARVKGLGYHGIRRLTEHFRPLSRVWQCSEDQIEAVLRAARLPAGGEVARTIAQSHEEIRASGAAELDRLSARHITLATPTSPLFPSALKDVAPAVYWLFVEGDPAALSSDSTVAVVGARNATAWGKRTATRVATWLVRRGITIVSGLAEGIDEAAHQVAVDAARPTIAVLGHGLSVTFPSSTAGLRQDIVRTGGAVVTEYLPSERYDRAKFINRNRILAGLGRALVPVEGEYASGTARAARYAHEFRRQLVGVRANATPPMGIHRLLAELGAPIIDLASPDANARFAEVLSTAFHTAVPAEPPPGATDVLARIVQDFRQLAQRYEITAEDMDSLVERLRAVMSEGACRHDH